MSEGRNRLGSIQSWPRIIFWKLREKKKTFRHKCHHFTHISLWGWRQCVTTSLNLIRNRRILLQNRIIFSPRWEAEPNSDCGSELGTSRTPTDKHFFSHPNCRRLVRADMESFHSERGSDSLSPRTFTAAAAKCWGICTPLLWTEEALQKAVPATSVLWFSSGAFPTTQLWLPSFRHRDTRTQAAVWRFWHRQVAKH